MRPACLRSSDSSMSLGQAEAILLTASSPGGTSISIEEPDRGGSRTDTATSPVPPPLLPELWGAIARAAVEAEGGTLGALLRLCSVSVAWRDGLKGENVMSCCCGMDPEEAELLGSASRRRRSGFGP